MKLITCLIHWHNLFSPKLENFILGRIHFKGAFFTVKAEKMQNLKIR